MSRIEAVVVGVGSMGQRHIRNLRIVAPEASISAVATRVSSESVPEGADRIFSSLADALVLRPSVAVIASPAPLHAEHGLACAKAGAHLLVEKPIATNLAAAEELVEACRRANLALMVGYTLRFTRGLPAIRDLVRKGGLGEVYYARAVVGQYLPDWRPQRDYRRSVSARHKLGGGALLELSHDIDAICYVLGQPVEWVTSEIARLGDLEIDVEDWATVIIGFGSARGSVHMDFLRRDPTRELVVVGSRGTATWDAWSGDLEMRIDGDSRSPIRTLEPGDRNEMYLAQLRAVLRASEGEPVMGADGASGIRTLEIVEAAFKSAEIGKRIEISGTLSPHEKPWTDQ